MASNDKIPIDKNQLDIEATDVDRASRAVREFQSGKCTHAYVKAALKRVSLEDLETVAFATRSTVRTLTLLRG